MWHDDATGGYLIYANRLPVFIDDRAELFGADFFREFVNTRRGTPAWRSTFDRYGIEQALVASDVGLGRRAHRRGLADRLRGRSVDGLLAKLNGDRTQESGGPARVPHTLVAKATPARFLTELAMSLHICEFSSPANCTATRTTTAMRTTRSSPLNQPGTSLASGTVLLTSSLKRFPAH